MAVSVKKQLAVLRTFDEGILRVTADGVIETSRARNGRSSGWRPKKLYISPYQDYFVVKLTVDGKAYIVKAHHVVMLWRLRHPFDPWMEVNHIDGNKLNNHPTNLELVTRSENQRHAVRNGLSQPPPPRNKLTWSEVGQIRELYATGALSQRQLGHMFGVDQKQICRIVNNVNWKDQSQLSEAR